MKLTQLPPFKLERYFAQHEFTAPYLLSCSDSEPISLHTLLGKADDESKNLWNQLTLHYTETQGHPILRKEIASLYDTINTDQVFVVVPSEGILLALNALIKDNDHVIAPFPAYQSLYDIAKGLGAEVSFWKPRQEEKWNFAIEDLEALITKRTRMLVINFPHNPTGSLPSRDEFYEIIALARKHKLVVFSDEMYRGLEYNSEDQLFSVADVYENGISLCGMSKVYSMPGERIGWLTTKNKKFMDTIQGLRDFTTICSSASSEILAIMGLRARKEIIDTNLKIIKNNIQICNNFFTKYSHLFSWVDPKAGSIGFPRFLGEGSIDTFVDTIRKNTGVMILPGSVYDWPESNFRIGLGRKNMSEVLQRVSDYLEQEAL